MIDIEKFVKGVHNYIGIALKPLSDRIKALESRALEKGDPGADGKDGKDGKDGSDGKDADPEQIKALVREAVSEIKPINGKDGRDGTDGKNGGDGTNGIDGKDGKSVTLDDVRPLFEAEFSKWALDFERRAQGELNRAVDKIPTPKDGRDGTDGRDGLGFDDLTLEQTGDRSAVLRFCRGEQIKEFTIDLPAVIDCGVYKEGAEYQRGDAVTWGGSLWIAQGQTKDKPGTDGWRLAVKKGRDGKDGKDGERGLRGLTGADGRDLTQLGMDGSKW